MELNTIAPTIDESGIHAPTFDQTLEWLKTKYRGIYGSDAYLENDSMDGQWLGVLALQFSQTNSICIKTYNSFNPKTAGTDALTRNVKINGIRRALSTFSTADIILIGTPGTTIKNGVAGDDKNNRWLLPASVTIPASGEITVTATAEKAGAVFAPVGSVNRIFTPTRGWTAVLNINTSSIGQDVEGNSQLRQRQSLSVSISALSQVEAMRAAILNLGNVSSCKTFENKGSTVDSNNLPPKSVCVVVSGGDAQEIAKILHSKKSMGCAWYGNTNLTVLNAYNEPDTVSFYRPNTKNISFTLQITANETYSADTAITISQHLADYVNALDISDKIMQNKLYGPANLYGAEESRSYEVVSIITKVDGVDVVGDYELPFGTIAFCDPSTIGIEVAGG